MTVASLGLLIIAAKITNAVVPFIPVCGFLGPCSVLDTEVAVALGMDGV